LPPGNKFAELKNTQWMAFFQITRVPEKIRVRSKLKVQNSSTFQGPKLRFFKHQNYPQKGGHSKRTLQCNTEVYSTVLTNTVMISKQAK